MFLNRTWRFIVMAALLLAQQSSLVHQIWHAGAPGVAAASTSGGDAGKGNPLCDQHTALKAVVGALSGCAVPALALDIAATIYAAAPVRAPGLTALTPSSRGPPSLS